MTESFISTKDRIISTAIEIISDSGISQLTTKTVSLKANISEPLLYKFYGDMNELLVDVVDYYFKFDNTVEKTVRAQKGRYIDKIMTYVETYATYYDSYSELCTLMLQFEELLHRRPPPPGDGGESGEGRREGGWRGREERGAGKIRRAGLNPPGGLRGPHPFTS